MRYKALWAWGLAGFLYCWLWGVAIAIDQDPSPATAPDLQELAPDWWNYFEHANPAERTERVDELLQHIKKTTHASNQAAIERLEQAFGRWQTTLEQKTKTSLDLPPLAPRQAHYSLTELLQLHARLQERSNDLSARTDQVQQTTQTQSRLRNELADLKLKYLETDTSDPARNDLVLDWLYKQVRLATVTAELSNISNTRDLLEDRTRQLREDFNYAQEHLAKAEPDPINAAALAQAQQSFAELQTRLEQQDLTHTLVDDTSLVGELQQQAQTLQTRQLAIETAQAQAQVIRLQAGLYLYELLATNGTDEPDYGVMREFVRQARDSSLTLGETAEQWRAELSKQRGDSSVEPEAATDKTADPKQIKNLQTENRQLSDSAVTAVVQLEINVSGNNLLLDLLHSQILKQQGGARAAVSAVTDTAGTVVEFSLDSLRKPLFEINQVPITSLSILRFGLILLVAWLLSVLLRNGLRKFARARGREYDGPLFIVRRVLHYIIIIIGFMVGLSSIGVDVSKFALIASALSIGIGFGLQNMINNFVSGIILLFEKSLKIGDFVELASGVTGEVREMRVRSTVITTNDNVDIVVPNSEFVSGRVVNWTMREAYRRIRIPFGVAYGTDKELVRRILIEAAEKVPYTLLMPNRKPQVWLTGFGDNALNFDLVVWLTPDAVKRPGAVHAHYCWEIETALKLHHIEMPFPQRDLHIRTAPALAKWLGDEARPTETSVSYAEKSMVDPPK